MSRPYKFSESYIFIDDKIYKIIFDAYEMHGRSYGSLARTLNMSDGLSIKKMIDGRTKHIKKDNLEMLKCLVNGGNNGST